ncbi:hypothetical protein PF005_g9912 [Phytophthora fragariae]|uniref:Uncharacterized protein n=1 Tax=Phytophthora fragariae TaxID=53985 RepID=A0A6A3Y8M8_9STRA|nr:hypothetical protein PF003_g4659 [Phytophthora fragariae]KAE8939463.1 hypothetical protein PF009_g10686 [Phytophthora fragariae]KAE9012977.1 hypothetical protein PF011_g8675 [Phytophthora fragariae]KAE9110802.1 hypothetical protein PF007_g11724 [Phytophthora fragariae]KAE9115684.1 hypothetical protein PF010_g9243 [Phytophthora fragariae]
MAKLLPVHAACWLLTPVYVADGCCGCLVEIPLATAVERHLRQDKGLGLAPLTEMTACH